MSITKKLLLCTTPSFEALTKKAAEQAIKAEVEEVVKKLLADGMRADDNDVLWQRMQRVCKTKVNGSALPIWKTKGKIFGSAPIYTDRILFQITGHNR